MVHRLSLDEEGPHMGNARETAIVAQDKYTNASDPVISREQRMQEQVGQLSIAESGSFWIC